MCEQFLMILAYFIGIPCTIIFLIKMISGIHEQKNYGGPGWFVVSAICWAWILSR